MIQTPVQPDASRQTTQVRPRASLKVMIWYWFPPLAWLGMVLLASTDAFSARHTGDILGAVLAWALGHLDAHTFDEIHFLVRKSAHFTEYAILSALWFRAFRVGLSSFWQMRWAVLGLAISLAVATLDEVHQSFLPSRSGSARDVLLDFCGALFAQLVIWYAVRRRGIQAVET